VGVTSEGHGTVGTYASSGGRLVGLGQTIWGDGAVTTYTPSGKNLVQMYGNFDGGRVRIWNREGKYRVLGFK
jgi:hypothetical protein